MAGRKALDLLNDDGAFVTGVACDGAQGSLEGLADGVDAHDLVGVVGLNGIESLGAVEQSHAATCDDAFLNSCAGCLQGVLDAGLLLLELGLGGCADLQNRNAAGELGQALLELLLVEVGLQAIVLGAHGGNASVDGCLVACAVDDDGGVLGDLDGLGGAQGVGSDVGQSHAEVLGDDLAVGDDGDVLEDAATTLAEAGGLDGHDVQGAAQLVQKQGAQSLTVDVLGDDEQGAAGLHDGLQQGNHVLDGGDLKVGEQDVGVVQDGLHALGIGCHVRGDVATVVLHALDDLEVHAEGLGILDGDGTVLANGVHGLGDLGADHGVTCGDGADVGDLLGGGNLLSVGFQSLDDGVGCLLDATTDGQGIGACGDVAQALGNDDVGQQGCGGGTVTGNVVGLDGSLADQLSAHVLDGVLKLDLAGDGHAVVGDHGSTVGALQRNVAAFGAKGDLDGIGKLLDACGHAGAGVGIEQNILCHNAKILSFKAAGRLGVPGNAPPLQRTAGNRLTR